MGRRKKSVMASEKFDIGSLYQKSPNDNYYFRYQINNKRKSISLRTKNYTEAKAKALKLLPVIRSTSAEVLAAHVSTARSLEPPKETLPLSEAWDMYSKQPNRATPATVSEQLSYQSTFEEFVNFIDDPLRLIHEITYEDALGFAEYLKPQGLAVDTHNRKIKRLRKIFEVLKKYCHKTESPFKSPSLLRKTREEQNQAVRRLAFSREQVQQILQVLDDPTKKVINKDEVKIIYFLGIYTGQRLKDCVLLRWNRIYLNRRIIEVKQFKTGKEVNLPIAQPLYDVLLEAQKFKKNDSDYVCPKIAERYSRCDKRGKNIGAGLVNIDILRVIKWAGIETSVKVEGRKKAVTVYGFHSLRHSFASYCAEAGVPKAVVLSILGTDSDIVDKYYTHISEEAQHRAMTAIAGEIGTLSPADKINRTMAYINTLPNNDHLQEIKRLLIED